MTVNLTICKLLFSQCKIDTLSLMKQVFVIKLRTLMRIRAIFSGRRAELATKSKTHYNTVCRVLSGKFLNSSVIASIIEEVESLTEGNPFFKYKDADLELLRELYSKAVQEQNKVTSSSN